MPRDSQHCWTLTPSKSCMDMNGMDELLVLKPSQKREWKEAEYAVYFYSPNKETLEKSPTSMKTVGAGFSLSLVGTSILPDREHFLREQIGTKLSQSTLYPGSGQVTTLDPELFPPPSQSYYCLMEVDALEASTGSSSNQRLMEVDALEASAGSSSNQQQCRHFLLCFVSIGKQGLDLFRTELDAYCERLLPLLNEVQEDSSSQIFSGEALEMRMKTWFSENICYLSRVVNSCHSELPALLHTAVNSTVQVVGDNEESVRDVELFVEACSLANLMQFEPGVSQNSVTITVAKEGCTVSNKESSKFCENWAQVLLAQGTSSPDPFFLRHAVENYKLKIIQDINALKRLLRQAESDYHALFRCYAFLCVCGNGKLLLQCAMQEAQSLPSPEALGVLEALHVYTDRCGFSLRTS